jgi:hypothetical protein
MTVVISFSEISQVFSDFEKEFSEIRKLKVMSIATSHTQLMVQRSTKTKWLITGLNSELHRSHAK